MKLETGDCHTTDDATQDVLETSELWLRDGTDVFIMVVFSFEVLCHWGLCHCDPRHQHTALDRASTLREAPQTADYTNVAFSKILEAAYLRESATHPRESKIAQIGDSRYT